jgi:inner membrane protein
VIELLEQISFLHWLAFGFILLTFELVGSAGYFLWLGLSALIVGITLSIRAVPWEMQLLAFFGFAILTSWMWWKKRQNNNPQYHLQNYLELKSKQLIGYSTHIDHDVFAGDFTLQIGNMVWTANTSQTLTAGTTITIIDIKENILYVEPNPLEFD